MEGEAIRARVVGHVQGVGFRDAAVRRADQLGVLGWVRNGPEGDVLVHAEGDSEAVARFLEFLNDGPRGAAVDGVELTEVKVEGHEQFAVRGVPAGEFVVRQHKATSLHFDFRLQVGGALRSWAVPKGPSLDPADKRLAVQVPDHAVVPRGGEERAGPGRRGAIVWDRGTYEQGGRVPWPEALDRGHAVFVLHGHKLHGGFALQRTRPDADPPQWLLVKRRDQQARPGYDVVAHEPRSVISGQTLDELIDRDS
jgi:DNA ligase D-like protein (predicted 3'-phosphoesterase)